MKINYITKIEYILFISNKIPIKIYLYNFANRYYQLINKIIMEKGLANKIVDL